MSKQIPGQSESASKMKQLESNGRQVELWETIRQTGTNLGAIKDGVWQDGFAFNLHTMQFVKVLPFSELKSGRSWNPELSTGKE